MGEVVAPVDTARRARSGSPTIIGTGQRRYLVASPGPGQRVDMGRHTPPSARRMETPLMQQLQMQMPAMPSWGSATAPSMPPQNPSANLFCAQGQSQPKLAPPNLLGSIAGLSTNFSSETSSGLSCWPVDRWTLEARHATRRQPRGTRNQCSVLVAHSGALWGCALVAWTLLWRMPPHAEFKALR